MLIIFLLLPLLIRLQTELSWPERFEGTFALLSLMKLCFGPSLLVFFLLHKGRFIYFIFYLCVYMPHMCRCPVVRRGCWIPRAGLTGGCEHVHPLEEQKSSSSARSLSSSCGIVSVHFSGVMHINVQSLPHPEFHLSYKTTISYLLNNSSLSLFLSSPETTI